MIFQLLSRVRDEQQRQSIAVINTYAIQYTYYLFLICDSSLTAGFSLLILQPPSSSRPLPPMIEA